MAGKTPHVAVSNFLTPIQRALSCITTVQISTSGDEPGKTLAIAVSSGAPVLVETASRREHFRVTVLQNYRVVKSDDLERGPWKISTMKYVYSLDDDAGNVIVAYHWHPDIGPRYPHLHVRATARRDVMKAHFPTARISLEEFVRLLIEDFDVRPRRSHWKKILVQTQATFERYRTWHIRP